MRLHSSNSAFLNLNKKYFFSFTVVFILMTPVGTITHELGHFFVATKLGYTTFLHYSNVNWNNELLENAKNQYKKFKFEIDNDLPFAGHKKYKINIKKIK